MKYHEFTIKIPAVVSKSRTAAYIRDAVESWSGGYNPADPMFGAYHGKVRVRGKKLDAKVHG